MNLKKRFGDSPRTFYVRIFPWLRIIRTTAVHPPSRVFGHIYVRMKVPTEGPLLP